MQPAMRQRPTARPQSTAYPATPARPHGQSPRYAPAQRRQQRRQQRRRRRITILVMLVSVAALFSAALLFITLSNRERPAPPPAVSPTAAASQLPAAPSATARVQLTLPVYSVPDRVPTAYDEAFEPTLFNYGNAIPSDYALNLVSIGAGQQMQASAAKAYNDMAAAAAADGISLVPLSGYRSHQRQTDNYNASIQRYLQQGLSQENAERRTEGYYAIPGTSEHEAGLAIDIGDAKVPGANIQDSFENTAAFAWLQEHGAQYGFILRYAADTFDITRIHYEPWHYRYVGANYAEKIVASGLTLEEYLLGEAEAMRLSRAFESTRWPGGSA